MLCGISSRLVRIQSCMDIPRIPGTRRMPYKSDWLTWSSIESIVPPTFERVLGLADSSSKNGEPIVLCEDKGDTSQQWYLKRVG